MAPQKDCLRNDRECNNSTHDDGADVSEEDLERNTAKHTEMSPQDSPVRSDLVEFDGPNDPGNPKNWSVRRRIWITLTMALMTFVVTFASTVFSVAIGVVAVEFEVGYVVSTLGVSLFVLGFVFGPIVFGPLSEVYGRKRPLFIGYVSFAIFQIPVAVAQNLETVMISRFLGGFAACAPLAIIGGALADMWDPIERAYAICAFAFGVFVGPVAGPIAGGFITESHLGWRWTAWLTLIMASTFGAIGFFVIPETSAARILQDRARDLRYSTKNWALHAKADESRTDAKAIAFIYLLRPFRMIVQEPILLLMTLYMSFVYGMLYLFFEAYPIAFVEIRGWSLGTGALPFAAFIAGVAIGSSAIAYSTAYHFAPSYKANDNRSVPEERLPPMIFGGVLLPVGLFWFAWTSDPGIHWISQVLASAVISIGCITSFWQGMNYIIDCYGFYSNSAIAVNTFIRSIAGAGFPLFAPAMYHNLGVDWATSVLGFLTLAFAPMPVLFYIYGARVRAKSRFAPTN